MANLLERTSLEIRQNPLDIVEQLVSDHEWPFERQGEDDLTVGLGGNFCEFQLWFSWREDINALSLSCAFDLKAPANRRRDLAELIMLANERMPIGHFDLWKKEGMVIFRHTLLQGAGGLSADQIETLVEIALNECERFYPAFQFLMWGGKSADEAIMAALLETVGEA